MVSVNGYAGTERRESTPVTLAHWPAGAKVAAIALVVTMVVYILITGMAYQKLVDGVNVNRDDITDIRSVDLEFMRLLNEATNAVTSLTTSVGHLADDVERVDNSLNSHRVRSEQ